MNYELKMMIFFYFTRFTLFFLGLTIFLQSCDRASANQQAPNLYFNLNHFIKTQINYLDSLKPSVEKKIWENDNQEQKILRTVDWKNELKMFLDADIDKPAYKDLYAVKDSTLSDKILRIYTAKAQYLHTRQIKIESNPALNVIHSVFVHYKTDDFLFQSERKLLLELDEGKMKTYHIQGYQKNIFGGHYEYEALGKLTSKSKVSY